MAWSLVCPASRGIGFQLTRRLLETTHLPVVATARTDADKVKRSILDDLKDVDEKRLTVLEVDVTSTWYTFQFHAFLLTSFILTCYLDEDSIQRAADKAESLFPPSKNHLHLAFCIPGILYPEKSPSQLDQKQMQETFSVNTIGPLLLSKHFTPFLPKKSTKLSSFQLSESDTLPKQAVWLNMAARVGSTSDNSLGGWYSYRASKAGVYSITKTLDLYLKTRSGENAVAIAYHPGTVKTGLSKEFWSSVKPEKLFGVEDAVEKMMKVVQGTSVEQRGRCWDWKGEEIKP